MSGKTAYDNLILQTAGDLELDGALLIAQVMVESGGQADAFRFEPDFYRTYVRNNPRAMAARFGPLAACSYGLLQLMLEVAYEMGYQGLPHQLFDPAINLHWGATKLRQLVDRYSGDVERALCAYNGGLAAVVAKPYRTQAYADKVFAEKDRA